MTSSDAGANCGDAKVLLLPATTRDGDAICKLLKTIGTDCIVFQNLASLASAAASAAGAVIVAEDYLTAEPDALIAALSSQPVWSAVPVIVLSQSGVESPQLTAVLPQLGNVTVLERPLRMNTFVTVIRSALRARERQYEVRDHLADLAEIEDRRRALFDAERNARAEAEHQSRMKDEFLATLSHELRTPLNAIMGWSQLLLLGKDELPANTAEGLEAIERNARSQTQIIEDLLDMSRIIASKVLLDVKPMNLNDVIRASIETLKLAMNAKSLLLESNLDGSEVILLADAHRLQQVFWNLLGNAVKFTPPGGRVDISVTLTPEHAEVCVSDSGEGITPEFLPYLFDRFRQADATITRRHGGLGLGLSIVRQLVELHGGTIVAESGGIGCGSAFTVTLPRAAGIPRAATNQSDGTLPSAAAPGAIVPLTGVHVLVVDDEPDARNYVARLLRTAEATVTTAESVAEAMTAISRQSPDLLISDIGMPVEDGYDLIRKVRALPADQGGNVPAIALTAFARPQDAEQALTAGFQMHFAKPVDVAQLIASLHRVLDTACQSSSNV